jgi:hypothetical protein
MWSKKHTFRLRPYFAHRVVSKNMAMRFDFVVVGNPAPAFFQHHRYSIFVKMARRTIGINRTCIVVLDWSRHA